MNLKRMESLSMQQILQFFQPYELERRPTASKLHISGGRVYMFIYWRKVAKNPLENNSK